MELMDLIITSLSRVGTFLLGISSLYGCFFISRYRKEKRLEKRSQIAEESLNLLETSTSEILQWLQNAPFVIRADIPQNAEWIKQSPENAKWEVGNYAKSFTDLHGNFISAQTKAKRLNSLNINQKFTQLHKCVKPLPNILASLHRIEAEKACNHKNGVSVPEKRTEKQVKDQEILTNAHEPILKAVEELQQILTKILTYADK